MTQSTTGTANSYDVNRFKTNKFYVDIDYSDAANNAWRKSCNLPSTGGSYLSGPDEPQVYLFSDYS